MSSLSPRHAAAETFIPSSRFKLGQSRIPVAEWGPVVFTFQREWQRSNNSGVHGGSVPVARRTYRYVCNRIFFNTVLTLTAVSRIACNFFFFFFFSCPRSEAWPVATPCTSCLHLARSSAYTRILSNVYPVHWKMLSIHVVFGLPLFRDPGVVPCIICLSKLSELLRITCPKYVNFLAFTDSRRFLDTSAVSSTQSFVRFAVHDTRNTATKVKGPG